MPHAKRASMREGPLADLFRKTAEETSGGGKVPASDKEPVADKPAESSEPPPAESASRPPAESAPRPPAESASPAAGESAPRPAEEPAAQAQPQSPESDAPERRVPSPQERLRNAFSADIPENLMESHRPPEPEPEPYARPDAVQPPSPKVGGPLLRVVGIGGAGVNAVNRMIEAQIEGVEFLAINTDLQSLQQSAAHDTLHIGDSITRGLGSGSNPDLGRQAARDEYDRIKAMLRGSDMIFIAAGAGGGTGTGAAPVIAQIARELGALTVGIITLPFQFEGSRRRAQAEAGIEALSEEVDTLIVVPNNRLLTVLERNTSMVEAFRVADDVLRQGVQGISDLVTLPGLINLDFADVRTIMSGAGNALLGIGMGVGDRRAIDASEQAVSSPLLDTSMEGARKILLSITGGRDLSLWEVNEAAKAVAEAAHPDANIIFGAMLDEKLEDQVWVTVVATGYEGQRRYEGEGPGFSERTPSEGLREPSGEPRVSRMRDRRAARSPAVELDVPEFIPRR